jgi:hypothetical protein
MDRASLPFLLLSTPAVRAALKADLDKVAVLAMRAVLRHRRGIEVAHQQIKYRKHLIAFSSRIGKLGDLILELDLGTPALGDRLILEQEFREAEAAAARNRNAGARRRPG